jgi:glycerol-3-phosphate O-acyltransferase/dihydroxyacetone phosphate acyltransferase
MLYPLLRLLARLSLRLFFRRIEVEGRGLVPATGPVLFVANHTNALIDPLALVMTLRRRLTLTAKNVLARNPLLGFLMRSAGVITFHRREDVGKGADRRENVRSLEQCRAVLGRGGALCIFPEGVSHSDLKMRPFRLGAARLALDFVRAEGNPGRLQIVPVGLLYTEKDRFRSAVWLRYGPPLDVAGWLSEHPEADTLMLTEEIHRRIEALTLHYETRRESLILSWGAEVIGTGGQPPAPLGWKEPRVAESFRLLARLQTAYRALLESQPDQIETITRRVRQYRSELKRLGIAPAEVYLPLHYGKALFFVIRELELLLAGAPLALFGAVNHLAPYLTVRAVARVLSKDRDHWATNVVYPSLLVFPFFYLIQLTAAWLLLPAWWAGMYTIALPYTGLVALLYGERAGASWRRLRTFLYFLTHPEQQHKLAQEGRAIIAAVQAMAEEIHE